MTSNLNKESTRNMGINENTKPFLQVKDIKKSFGHVEALRGATLESYRGEILAIVGDNGAGKSTLIKILSGAIVQNSGELWIEGEKQEALNPKTALKKGISTVYQDLALADTRDVASNIFLGREPLKYGFINKKNMDKEARRLIENLGVNIPDIKVPVGTMSGGQRQGVAVARAVHQGGKLLIFDEPTAAMGLIESRAVLKLIKGLAEEGYGVIIISHNLQQVFQIAHRVCVMRQGKVVKTMKTSEVKAEDVVSMITGAMDKGENNE